MAKAKLTKPAKEEPKQDQTKEPLDPKKAHELLGISGPYEPPPPPILTKGYVTFWDPGCSIQTLTKKKRELFHLPDLLRAVRQGHGLVEVANSPDRPHRTGTDVRGPRE